MRKSFAMATFFVAGAGAIGVGALTLAGSDTLFTITRDMVLSFNGGAALCSGATSITYNGGGSGAGENSMLAGNQTVAPMSRFLGANACKGVNDAGIPTTANGLIVALDGLAIIGSISHAGTAACNGATGGDDAGACTTAAGVPIDKTVGLVSDKTVTLPDSSTYTFNKWSDVLRILYMGKDHNGVVNCNSAIRNFLANSWASVFESAATGCTSGTCPGGINPTNASVATSIRHLWRRDDASGTTDVFSQLLGFGGPSASGGTTAAGTVLAFNGTSFVATAYHLGTDNFCNSAVNAGAPFNGMFPGENGGTGNSVSGGSSGTVFVGIVPNDHQDHDPIRRTCEGTGSSRTNIASEQVCEQGAFDPISGTWATTKQGTLGLLLPIVDANAGGVGANQYPTHACNTVIAVASPLIPNPNGRGSIGALCPNGDVSTANQCQVPGDNTVSPTTPNCLSTFADIAPPFVSNTGQGTITGTGLADTHAGPNPAAIDPRVFNKFIWQNTGTATAPAWSIANDNSNRPMYGSYYRIHTTQTMNNPNNVNPCALADATHQIGCLSAASPCSFGYAGKDGTNEPGATAMKVNGTPPVVACVQALGDPVNEYQIVRKLYLNSIVGFQSATTAEQALASCEANTLGLFNQAVAFEHFIPLPTTGPNAVNGGNSVCEDFNEQMLCGDAGANVNGCPAGAGVTGVSVTVTCGNGIKEAFEDCDPADPVSTAACPNGGAGCSSICRCN